MFNKKEVKVIKEVRLGKFKTEPNTSPEPDLFLELDEKSLKNDICYIQGNIAVNQNNDAYYILQREENGKIAGSELNKIHSNRFYVLGINNEKEFSRKETKNFFKNLKKSLERSQELLDKFYDQFEDNSEEYEEDDYKRTR